jgi:hypothetical protein
LGILPKMIVAPMRPMFAGLKWTSCLMWTRHQTVQEEHIQYIEIKIIKPYDMAIRDFFDHINKIYSYVYCMQLPSNE